MANRKSPAAQAIKDMLELNLEVSFFTGKIRKYHMLNAQAGIITVEVVTSKEEKKAKPHTPKPKKAPKCKHTYVPRHVYNQRIIINVDGTVSVDFTEWDYK